MRGVVEMVYARCVDEVPLGEDSSEDRTREFQQRAKDEDEIRRFTVSLGETHT